jgi:hypothetical protein
VLATTSRLHARGQWQRAEARWQAVVARRAHGKLARPVRPVGLQMLGRDDLERRGDITTNRLIIVRVYWCYSRVAMAAVVERVWWS